MHQFVALTALALLLGGPPGASAQSAARGDTVAPAAARPLRPGDVIRLRVWREPDMSGDFSIDEQGMVVLPRIGPMRVVDESPESLKTRLTGAFERYLQHPSIDVTLLRRVQVLGAVRSPGLYNVDATMTVSDALALAGGTTPEGDPDRVELIRGGRRIEARLSSSTRIVDSPIQSADQLFVPERSWISRNSGVIAAGLASLFIALLTR